MFVCKMATILSRPQCVIALDSICTQVRFAFGFLRHWMRRVFGISIAFSQLRMVSQRCHRFGLLRIYSPLKSLGLNKCQETETLWTFYISYIYYILYEYCQHYVGMLSVDNDIFPICFGVLHPHNLKDMRKVDWNQTTTNHNTACIFCNVLYIV